MGLIAVGKVMDLRSQSLDRLLDVSLEIDNVDYPVTGFLVPIQACFYLKKDRVSNDSWSTVG